MPASAIPPDDNTRASDTPSSLACGGRGLSVSHKMEYRKAGCAVRQQHWKEPAFAVSSQIIGRVAEPADARDLKSLSRSREWGFESPLAHQSAAGLVPWLTVGRGAMITLYVLEGEAGRRYVGITTNLPRRLGEHRSGSTHSGRLIGKFAVIHTEEFPDYSQARKRERFLKSGQGREFLVARYPRKRPACGG